MSPRRLPTLFIPHGGGPWPFMEPPAGHPNTWTKLECYLRGLAAEIGVTPRAVLAISGHWLAPRPTVSIVARPQLIFDYYNFPPQTYALTWPAPGAPELGVRVHDLLDAAGIMADETARGFDHGVFVPFMLIYPKADIPVLTLSLRDDLDPAAHLDIGRALTPLRDDGVLIVGSGMSYHNLWEFFSEQNDTTVTAEAFDGWLTNAVEHADPGLRDRALTGWATAPGARACHPTEEHLLPLMVAAGAAGADTGRRVFHDHLFGKALSGFQFG